MATYRRIRDDSHRSHPPPVGSVLMQKKPLPPWLAITDINKSTYPVYFSPRRLWIPVLNQASKYVGIKRRRRTAVEDRLFHSCRSDLSLSHAYSLPIPRTICNQSDVRDLFQTILSLIHRYTICQIVINDQELCYGIFIIPFPTSSLATSMNERRGEENLLRSVGVIFGNVYAGSKAN